MNKDRKLQQRPALYLLPLLLLLLLLHALLDLTQQAGWVWGEALEAALLRQLLQPGSQLPVGHLNLLELQLALSQLDKGEKILSNKKILSDKIDR